MIIRVEENVPNFGTVTHMEAENSEEQKGLGQIWNFLRPTLLPEQIKFSGDLGRERGFEKLHLMLQDAR
jgi:hypothetical protein